MDPRIARIQAAQRMPLPRLAADALADALAFAAEVARLRSQVTVLAEHVTTPPEPPPAVAQQMAGYRRQIATLQGKLKAANTELLALKAEARRRDAEVAGRVLSADRTGSPCEMCGTPTKRPGTKHCRDCFRVLAGQGRCR